MGKCPHNLRFQFTGSVNNCCICDIEALQAENARLREAWDAVETNHWALNWEPGVGWEVSSFDADEWIVNKIPTPLEAVLAAIEKESKP